MHRISDPRIGGTSRKNIEIFRKLCGDDRLDHVCIVTTYWDRVGEEGKRRVAALRDGAFKALIDAGAQVVHHDDGLGSARSIISKLISQDPVSLAIQNELEDDRKLADTSAGAYLDQEIKQEMEATLAELDELKKQKEEATAERDETLMAELTEVGQLMVQKIQRLKKSRRILEMSVPQKVSLVAACGAAGIAAGLAIAGLPLSIEVVRKVSLDVGLFSLL